MELTELGAEYLARESQHPIEAYLDALEAAANSLFPLVGRG